MLTRVDRRPAVHVKHHLAWILALLSGACGASPAPDLHAAFRSIQIDEARIEHASAALESSGDEAERGAAVLPR
jgi:hypothetical protein